jgi:hypothetical protein
MNRFLIFCASLLLTFVTISSACSASASAWHRPVLAGRASASLGTAWFAVTPSRLMSIDAIRL